MLNIPLNEIREKDFVNHKKFEKQRHCNINLPLLAKAVTTKYGIGGLKMAMDLAGYFGGNPRPPLKRPGKDVEEELKKLFLKLKES